MKYKKINYLKKVASFMTAFKQPVLVSPKIPSKERCDLRVSLLREELTELEDAIKDNNIVEIADALVDLQYVLSGAVHEFGLGHAFNDLFNEVHSSNMSKICTGSLEAEETIEKYKKEGIEVVSESLPYHKYIIKRKEDNKVLKNINYFPAALESIINSYTISND